MIGSLVFRSWAAQKGFRRGFNCSHRGDMRRRTAAMARRALERVLSSYTRNTRAHVKDFRTFRRDPAQLCIIILAGCGHLLLNMRYFYQQDVSAPFKTASVF